MSGYGPRAPLIQGDLLLSDQVISSNFEVFGSSIFNKITSDSALLNVLSVGVIYAQTAVFPISVTTAFSTISVITATINTANINNAFINTADIRNETVRESIMQGLIVEDATIIQDSMPWSIVGPTSQGPIFTNCWASDLNLICALSNNKSYLSSDGSSWTTYSIPVTTPTARPYNGVCRSPELGLFCGVDGSQIIISSDGQSWTTELLVDGLYGICWSPDLGLFCAVGSNSEILVSSSGTSWISSAIGSSNLTSVCWSPSLGIFCAVGSEIYTSTSGTSWSLQTSALTFSQQVCWSPEEGIFCAVNSSRQFENSVQISSDGVNWYTQSPTTGSTWWSVCWSSDLGIFVALAYEVDIADTIMVSRNGVNWLPSVVNTTVAAGDWYNIIWAGPPINVFSAVTDNDVNDVNFMVGSGNLADYNELAIFGGSSSVSIGGQSLVLGTKNIGLYDAVPVPQATTSVSPASFSVGTDAAITIDSTFNGYTVGQLVTILQDIGIIKRTVD
jgi:hypothetical protein